MELSGCTGMMDVMKKRFLVISLLIWGMAGMIFPAFAEIRVSSAFTDNAVLQREKPINIWGWAEPGEKITVSFNGQTVKGEADSSGKWLLQLPAMSGFCEGKELVAEGENNRVALQNIVVGEVWVCSGQSNMEWTLGMGDMMPDGEPRYAATFEERTGNYDFVRYNRNEYLLSKTPMDDVVSNSGWVVCKEGQQANCTAVGFHFAVRLYQELHVPVGLISSSWGGSFIESWMPDECWERYPVIRDFGAGKLAERVAAENCEYAHAGGMFYAKVAAWIPYTIRGVIWYQGCANSCDSTEMYYYKQRAMIEQWRAAWGQGDFPFYWVQLAAWEAPQDDPNYVKGDTQTAWYAHTFKTPDTDSGAARGFVWVRDAQTRCLEIPHTGQAITIDAGEEKDIHPRNKFIVGNRLALWALANDYGKNVTFASPVMKSVQYMEGKAIVRFDNVDQGLMVGKLNDRQVDRVENGELKRFAIAGQDRKFCWGTARIVDNNTVEIESPNVPEPVAVRYAWQMNPEGCNLYNSAGLPATPFRTDDWEE